MNDESPEEQVRQLYSQLALHPQQDFGWLKGKENAKNLGYDQKWLDQVPDTVWESAAAVGNPFSIGPIHLGETVVDLGCGAGADLCITALMVGNTGRVFGIDLTPAMVEKARSNIELMHLANVQVELGDFLNLPLEDNNVDVQWGNQSFAKTGVRGSGNHASAETKRAVVSGGHDPFGHSAKSDVWVRGRHSIMGELCGGHSDEGLSGEAACRCGLSRRGV